MAITVASAPLIQRTVLKVSEEAKRLMPDKSVRKRSERRLLAELVLCILSTQERYELAVAATRELSSRDLFRTPKTRLDLCTQEAEIYQVISQPISFRIGSKHYCRRMRFFTRKAKYIVDSMRRIYLEGRGIESIHTSSTSLEQFRRHLIKEVLGIGPKQASMFIRNAGYGNDLAILDTHVLKFMRIVSLIEGVPQVSTIAAYEVIETELKAYALSRNVDIYHLDIAIWVTMRTASRKL